MEMEAATLHLALAGAQMWLQNPAATQPQSSEELLSRRQKKEKYKSCTKGNSAVRKQLWREVV